MPGFLLVRSDTEMALRVSRNKTSTTVRTTNDLPVTPAVSFDLLYCLATQQLSAAVGALNRILEDRQHHFRLLGTMSNCRLETGTGAEIIVVVVVVV